MAADEPREERDSTPGSPADRRDPWVAATLTQAYDTNVRPETADRHHTRIAELCHELGTPAPDRIADDAPEPPRTRPRRLLVVATAACFVLLLPGAAVGLSGTAMPGDTLYDLKRSHEEVRLLVAPSDSARAWLLLEQAERRLDELERSGVATASLTSELVDDAIASLEQAEEVPDAAVQREVARLRTDVATRLTNLAPQADPDAGEVLRSASQRVEAGAAHDGDGGSDGPTTVPRSRQHAGDDGADTTASADDEVEQRDAADADGDDGDDDREDAASRDEDDADAGEDADGGDREESGDDGASGSEADDADREADDTDGARDEDADDGEADGGEADDGDADGGADDGDGARDEDGDDAEESEPDEGDGAGDDDGSDDGAGDDGDDADRDDEESKDGFASPPDDDGEDAESSGDGDDGDGEDDESGDDGDDGDVDAEDDD